ncbi:hypothetical protein COCON_G00138100 [Conger conger]|uniref:Uncharacterized protein n=1 Tax=Conger conger TaxID=82655 RepID=A0A9Q1DFB2_CONCO|nr:hypothetical protein COCON_G00138100 [Conger conger]
MKETFLSGRARSLRCPSPLPMTSFTLACTTATCWSSPTAWNSPSTVKSGLQQTSESPAYISSKDPPGGARYTLSGS